MSKTVDNRVVQMQFDNQQFERGVKQSMNSLNELDGSLNKLNKNSNTNGFTSALKSIQSSLENINPTRWHWVNKLWTEVEKLGAHITSKLLGPLNTMKEGGWGRALSLEQARFQFEGLGIDVEKAMKSANDAVADTAYGLDEAATAASMLTTSGVEAGDELTKALTAISGVTAQVNGNYSDIANIFTDIAAAGKVTGDSLTRLAYRGLNGAQVLGEAMGKSAADVKKLASQGKISFKEFYEAMYDKYAEHAYKANETYTGSLANMHAALKKIGADFGQYKLKEMVSLHNSLRLAINKVRKELTPVSEAYGKIFHYVVKFATMKIDAFNAKPLQKVFEGLANILIFVLDIAKMVKRAFAEMFPGHFVKSFDQIATAFRDFTERLQFSGETVEVFKNILQGAIAFIDIIKQIILGIGKALIPGVESMSDLVNVFLNFLSLLGKGLVLLDQWLKQSNIIARTVSTVKNVVIGLVAVLTGLILKLVELVKRVKESQIVAQILDKISQGFNKIKTAVSGLTKSLSSANKASGTTAANSKSGGMFGGISTQLSYFSEKIKGVVGEITLTKVVLAAFVVFVAAIAIALTAAAHKMANGVKSVAGTFKFFQNAISEFQKKTAEANEKKEKTKKWASFLIIVGELTALAFALKGLASQPLSQILAATVALGAIIYEVWKIMGDVALMPDKSKVEKNLKTMKGVALILVATGLALSSAAKQDWKSLIAAGGAMALCMQAMIKVIETVASIETPKITTTIDTLGKMSAVVSAFPVIARALKQLQKLNIGTIIAGAASLSGAIIALGETVKIVSKIDAKGINAGKIAALISLTVALNVIGAAISKVGLFNWKQIAASTASLVIALGAMAGIVFILSKIDDNGKSLIAAGSVALTSLALIPVAQAFQKLSFYDWADMGRKMIALNGTLVIMGGVLAALSALGMASEGIGVVVILLVSAALIGIAYAMKLAAHGCFEVAQGLKMLSSVNLKEVAYGLLVVDGAINSFPIGKTLGLALACQIGGKGFYYLGQGMQEFGKTNFDNLATGVKAVFDAVADSSADFVEVGASLTALGLGMQQVGIAITMAGIAMVPFGIGIALASVGILAACAGLRLLEPALEGMQNLNWESLKIGFGVITSSLSSLARTGIVFAFIGNKILSSAIAYGALAVECWAFSKMDLEAIARGLSLIAAGGTALALAGIVMSIGSLGVGLMAVAILALGKAFQVASQLIYEGVQITVKSLELLEKAGGFSVQGFVQGIVKNLPNVAKIGGSLGTTFVKAVTNTLGIASPSKILRAIGEFTGSGFILGVADKMDEAEKAGESLGLSTLMGTEGLSDLAKQAGQSLGLDFSGGFTDIVGSLFGGIGKNYSRTGAGGMPSDVAAKMSKGGLNGLTNSVKDLLGLNLDLDDSLKNITESAGGAGSALSDMGDDAKKGAKGVKEAKDEIKSFVEKIEGSFNILDEFDLGMDEENPLTKEKLLENMKGNIEGMAKWSNEMESLSGKVAQGLYKKLADMGPQGYKYVHAFTEMTKEELDQVNVYYATSLLIPTNVTTQVYRGMADAGQNALTGYINGLNIPYWQDLGVELATNFLTGMKGTEGLETHSPSKKTYEIGSYATQGLANGLRDPSAKEALFFVIQNMCREIISKFRLGLSAQNFKDIGQQVLRGLDQGINSKQPDVLKSADSLASKVIDKVKGVFQIKSPSRVFAEIGEYVDLGLAQGIAENASSVESSVNTMAQATVDNMRQAISTIQNVVDSDLNVEPVISPVVDLSNVQNGVGSINSLMDSFGSNVTMPSASFMTTSQLISNTDNTNVVDAIGGLQEDVINLKEAMTNIKMVLDTGTMVGAMTPAIDMELGSRQILAGRGI